MTGSSALGALVAGVALFFFGFLYGQLTHFLTSPSSRWRIQQRCRPRRKATFPTTECTVYRDPATMPKPWNC